MFIATAESICRTIIPVIAIIAKDLTSRISFIVVEQLLEFLDCIAFKRYLFVAIASTVIRVSGVKMVCFVNFMNS